MCKTCVDLHEIKDKSLKEKLKVIGDAMEANKAPAKQKHLLAIYEKVMNDDMPEHVPDKDVEKQWSKEMYGEENDDE